VNFSVISIFPEAIDNYLKIGIISRAVSRGLIQVDSINLRDFADNKYRKIDDYIFGYGRGMLFSAEPLECAVKSVKEKYPDAKTVYLSPRGRVFNNRIAKEYASQDAVILIAARYEGIDERIVELYVDDEISVGDYVLTGGELPSLVFIDAVSRFIDGTIHKDSAVDESFESGLLEYGHYAPPVEFRGISVPEVLRSGNHTKTDELRFYLSLRKTYFNRPDLLRDFRFPISESKSKDPLKVLKKKNSQMKDLLLNIQKISKEWKNVGRS
jgi:tRNA (guanine37-N1)-methyltransferase